MTRAEEIAAVLRERIASGRLRPGDRAPSTRAIMRDHGVAMATASKVLSLLQADGLIDSAPGRGSVVLAPDRSRAPALTAADVIAAAVAIADAESMQAVSMRRLAAALEIPTMAVYRYVPSRDELQAAMLDRVLADLPIPPRTTDWRADVEALLRSLWESMKAHPWLAAAMSMTRPAVLPGAMPMSEHLLAALRAAGLEQREAFTEYLCLLNLVRGLGATIEPELADRAATGVTEDEWIDTRLDELRAAAPPDRFPVMAEMLHTSYPYDADVLLDTALTRYLDGLAAGLARASHR
ncbi:TetR/AcrR family transcriptional regulator C-terminal domain-containing protein [Tsukamurella tyrosinosolvens]|uniref:winged helix-turn-helix domain-containing protein n=1 Tax=Tsukamurella tyrosinosolvens TaxID=57704 RepID=UPI001AF83C9F|nr:winged helix-turn-helix domain-containing protein [Tsukamurella tyrosinosolvens]QRY84590.1 TetR/AcrR family transcriptional regulator C-terminal domain-containing protein [Tsukamurella tyrosinosolvens]